MHRLVWMFFAIFTTMSACNQQLPSGYTEVGRFTGSINGKHYSLVSTSSILRLYLLDGTEEEEVDSDLEYIFKSGMHQYTIYLKNGFDTYRYEHEIHTNGYGNPPILKMIIQPDPMAAEGAKRRLRIDSIFLYNNGPLGGADYAAQPQSGFGAIETISLQTDKDGGINFEFEADLSNVAMTGSKMMPVPDGGGYPYQGAVCRQSPRLGKPC